MANRSSFITLIILAACAACSCRKQCTPIELAATDMLSVVVAESYDNRMIKYEGFEVGFNPTFHQPNFVAWELIPEHTDGPISRKNFKFQTDERVRGCATDHDYRRSGMTRGHMAPAADMKWSSQAMNDCHYFTNICPQDKYVNGGPWQTVEDNCRKWAKRYGPLYIVAGPVLNDILTRTIGKSKIPVPERFFKVVVAPYTCPPMGIGFIMPNSHFVGGAQQAVASIDEVEELTGFDFFSFLPDSIEADIEKQHSMAAFNH